MHDAKVEARKLSLMKSFLNGKKLKNKKLDHTHIRLIDGQVCDACGNETEFQWINILQHINMCFEQWSLAND